MWVWEVDEVVPIHLFIIKPWELLLRCYYYCHAMLVDVDLGLSDIHDSCEMFINGSTSGGN